MARGKRKNHTRAAQPLRRCISCREQKPKTALLRIAAVGGRAVLDAAQEWGGRGAWMCRDAKCATDAVKGRVAKALKGKGGQPDLKTLLGWVGEAKATQGPDTALSLDGDRTGG